MGNRFLMWYVPPPETGFSRMRPGIDDDPEDNAMRHPTREPGPWWSAPPPASAGVIPCQ